MMAHLRMDEEMRMLQLDKPGQGKSTTELQRHSIDESLFENRPVERSLYIVSKGDELQKLSVIGSLPELLKYDQKGTVSKIIPKIQQELPNSSSEFNLAVSRMFNILMHMEIPVNLVPQILQGIENRDPIIANAWMETLLSVIPLLKESVVKNDVLRCAISKSQLSKAPYFRVSSCRILGKVSVHKTMNPFEVKKDVLPLVQSLCQDCFHEVRAAMCRELPHVAQGLFHLGDAIVKVNLLPLLVELSADENVGVRCIAIESMVSIIPFLSPDTVKGTIIPLSKKLCTRSASEGDTTYTAIAAVFGTLISNLQLHMSASDAMWFLDYYSYISKKGQLLMEDIDTDPSVCMLCRENCAYCLPRLAIMIQQLIPTEITAKWYHSFKALAADPCYLVRKAVATCFSEIVKILGPWNKIVVIDFTKLLRDEDEEVLQALIPHIANIMELFVSTNVLQREMPVQATLDIGRAMLKCQSETFRLFNWRIKESLLAQWERLPNCFPSDFIHQHFTPVVLNATINGKAKPVRSQAARTLLIILKYSFKENHRKWIREMILTQLCNASCCYSRQVFVTLCLHALDIFSWRYFKDYFYLPLLSLAEDQVSIVRLCMVKLCPVMKQMLVLPGDRALQLKLENILSKMEMMESDKDVIMTLKSKLKEMRTVRAVRNEVLTEDKRKADEEDRILKGKWTGVKMSVSEGISEHSGEKSEKPVPVPVPKGQMGVGNVKPAVPSKRLADGVTSPMPFLDQHFYTDAGISLPQDFDSSVYRDRDYKSPLKTSMEVTKLIESAENLTSWLDEISLTDEAIRFHDESNDPIIKLEEKDMIISVENVNPAETLTENDVRALETTTTNMTDELKANIQNISEASNFKPKKRNSCIFSSEIRRASTTRSDASFKRRSLNIPSNESRIPISSRGNRLSYHEKSKSVSDQTLDASTSEDGKKMSRLSRFTRSAINLRENKSGTCKSLQRSRSFATNSNEAITPCDPRVEEHRVSSEERDLSRIPSIHSSKNKGFYQDDKKMKKDCSLDNIKRFNASCTFYSTNNVERKATCNIDKNINPFGFKRYVASENLSESIKNNNVEFSDHNVSPQPVCLSKSSNDTSAKLVEVKKENSGLPLLIRRKSPPK